MISNLRTHAIIAGGLFVALLLVAVGGNALFANPPLQGSPAQAALVGIFGIFLAFGFSLVPVMVMIVLRKAPAAQKPVIWALWAVLALGCLVAVPAAINDGFFRPEVIEPEAPTPTVAQEPPPLAPDPRYTLPEYEPRERRTAPH